MWLQYLSFQMKMIIFRKCGLWSHEALSFHFKNLYDDTGGINHNFILHNWKSFGKIAWLNAQWTNICQVSDSWHCVCAHTHVFARTEEPFMLQGREYTLVRQGGKHFDGFLVYSIKKFYNYLKRLLKISSLTNLHKSLNEGQIFFK